MIFGISISVGLLFLLSSHLYRLEVSLALDNGYGKRSRMHEKFHSISVCYCSLACLPGCIHARITESGFLYITRNRDGIYCISRFVLSEWLHDLAPLAREKYPTWF